LVKKVKKIEVGRVGGRIPLDCKYVGLAATRIYFDKIELERIDFG